jgi:uncharacterized OB-fold protein
MTELQPYIQTWFEHLSNGELMGVKCARCGGYEFPPVPTCNTCSATDMDWVEMSGEGQLHTFSFSPMGIPPYHTNPVLSGWIRLNEGVSFMSWFPDLGRDDYEPLLARLPVAVEAEITAMDENISWPVFRLKE